MSIAARIMPVSGGDSLELKIPPLVVVLIAAGLMLLMRWLTPMLAVPLDLDVRMWAALPLLTAGVAVAVAGVLQFRRSRTTVNPMTPERTSALVSSGIYRYTRNPMYAGMLLALLAFAIVLASPASLLMLPAFVVYMNRFQIMPEERELARHFGAEFQAYRARVRRWL
jgi:protein-S-isoprenylcysteine O-methyltransferase Ste14